MSLATRIFPVNKFSHYPVPFIKWAGGKSSLTKTILQHIPEDFNNYYEPFLGGAALFFSIAQQTTRFQAYLSDTNPELINTFLVVRDHPEKLIQSLRAIQRTYNAAHEKSSYYYQQRARQETDPIDQAARFIFLNKTCYNGLYRVNRRGEFNVPFGRYKNPQFYDPDNLQSVSRVLRETKASIQIVDYKVASKNARENDLVYFDPPYQPVSKTASFTGYTPKGFSGKDQVELANIFKELSAKGCHVILSNSDTQLVHELYNKFHLERVRVIRAINSIGSQRQGFTELLIYSPENGQTK